MADETKVGHGFQYHASAPGKCSKWLTIGGNYCDLPRSAHPGEETVVQDHDFQGVSFGLCNICGTNRPGHVRPLTRCAHPTRGDHGICLKPMPCQTHYPDPAPSGIAEEPGETKTHDLKTWLDPFEALWSGAKTFEIRKDDRGFRVGDSLNLREWNEGAGIYTGRALRAEVTYKVSGGLWGLPDHLCVLAIRLRPWARVSDAERLSLALKEIE